MLVPLRSPVFDASGPLPGSQPTSQQLVQALGNLNRTWALFFSSLANPVSYGTHLQRVGTPSLTPVQGVPDAGFFFETDRTTLYQSQKLSGSNYATPGATGQLQTQIWVPVAGLMTGVLAKRPIDLGMYDVGFQYSASDGSWYTWTGKAWSNFLIAGDIPDLSAVYATTGALTTAVATLQLKPTVAYRATGLTGTVAAQNLRTGSTALSIGTYRISLTLSPTPTGAAVIASTLGWTDDRSNAFTYGLSFTGSTALPTQLTLDIEVNGTTDVTWTIGTVTGTVTYNATAIVEKLR